MEMEKSVKAQANKCPNCGSKLSFDVNTSKLSCEHCGYKGNLEVTTQVEDRALTDEILKTHTKWTGTKVYKCQNCGAKEVLSGKNITHNCPFCGSSNVACTTELAGIKPDSLIPFLVPEPEARQGFRKWIKSKWYAPSRLKREAKANELHPVYNPAWTFDADTSSTYNGRLGESRTTRSRRGDGSYVTRTYTQWYNVNGTIDQIYDDYMVQSGSKIDQVFFDGLKPFNKQHYKPYRQEYLSGYAAEHYSTNISDSFAKFSEFVKSDIRRKIISKYRADAVDYLNINTSYSNKKFKYMLLPVYVSSFNFKGKLYNMYVNGASGKVSGKYPISFWKVLLTVVAVGAAIFAAIKYLG